VTVVAQYDRRTGQLLGQSRILTGGFVYTPESGDLLDRAQHIIRSAGSVKPGTLSKNVETRVERALADFFYRETRRRPVVRSAVMER
jgi:mRNA degradation ribonuclease J1/J2